MPKNNQISNEDIIRILKKYDITINGIYSKDTLPELKHGFYVVNSQSLKDGDGTHWCCFYYNKPLTSIWFDPYGFIANTNTQEKIKPYIYNDKDIQDYESSACGYYCICFIKFLHKSNDKFKAFDTFLKSFSDDTAENDRKLQNMLKIRLI